MQKHARYTVCPVETVFRLRMYIKVFCIIPQVERLHLHAHVTLYVHGYTVC